MAASEVEDITDEVLWVETVKAEVIESAAHPETAKRKHDSHRYDV